MAKRNMGLLEDRLKEYRYKRRWTQAQMAVYIGLGVRTIKRAEAGERLAPSTTYRLEQLLAKEALV